MPVLWGSSQGRRRALLPRPMPNCHRRLFQTLTVSVRNEYLREQKLTSENVLSQRFRVCDLYGEVITFVNLGETAPKGQPGHRVAGQLMPILRAGEAVVPGRKFSPSPTASPASADMFSAALSGSTAGPALVAQWLDFALEAPGRRSSVSRALTDFVDPRERAGGKILTKPDPTAVTASLAQGCAIAVSAGFIQPAAAVETAYAKLDGQAAGRAFDAPRGAKPTDEQRLDAARVWDQLLGARALTYAFAAERALTTLSVAVGPHVRLIRDQPMVTIVNSALGPSRDRKGVVAELSVDFRHDAVRVLVDSPATRSRASGRMCCAVWSMGPWSTTSLLPPRARDTSRLLRRVSSTRLWRSISRSRKASSSRPNAARRPCSYSNEASPMPAGTGSPATSPKTPPSSRRSARLRSRTSHGWASGRSTCGPGNSLRCSTRACAARPSDRSSKPGWLSLSKRSRTASPPGSTCPIAGCCSRRGGRHSGVGRRGDAIPMVHTTRDTEHILFILLHLNAMAP